MTKDIQALAERLGEVIHGENFGVVMHTLIYMLAVGGAQADMSKKEFLAEVYGRLDNLYQQFLPEGDDNGYSAIQ